VNQNETQYIIKIKFETKSKLKHENMSDRSLGLIRTSAMLYPLSDPFNIMIDHGSNVLTYPSPQDWSKESQLRLVPSLAEI
jgi:hypothetical protein